MPAAVYQSPTDSTRLNFMEHLATDLRNIGHRVRIGKSKTQLKFSFTPADFSKLDHRAVHDLYLKIHQYDLETEQKFIVDMENSGVLDLLVNGKDLQIDGIYPQVQVCDTERSKRIYRYFRQHQSIPTSPGVGRRICALVYDLGQPKHLALMGIIGLASTTYAQKDRDSFLGWNVIDSKSETKRVRDEGLRHIMQLAVCMALPPYNDLFGGKLMAALALSDPIQKEYRRRYHEPLLALLTTSATGLHAPIFNRIQMNRLEPAAKYRNYSGEFFRRIGETASYTTSMIGDDTVEAARTIFEGRTTSPVVKGGKMRSNSSRDRAIYRALSACSIGRDVLAVRSKGLYMAVTCEENLALLREGRQDKAVLALAPEDVFAYWKTSWLPRARRHAKRQRSILTFVRQDASLQNRNGPWRIQEE